MEFRKMVTITLYARQQETQMYRSLLDSVGEGKGVMILECSVETCISSYMKWIAGPGLMHETRYSRLVH